MRELVKVMKALSDGTRLRILNLLMERECCVCEVTEVLGVTQSTASRGLAALYDVGLLKRRRHGTWALFSINESAPAYCHQLIHAVEVALRGDETCLRDREHLRELAPMAACTRDQHVPY